jgi:mRNA interferase HigB
MMAWCRIENHDILLNRKGRSASSAFAELPTSQIWKIGLASRIGKIYTSLVNIVARKNLVAFWTRHPETEKPLRAWLQAADRNAWTSMTSIVATFSKASPVSADRCVFDICGGNYRLIVAFKFSADLAFIKFIGTHAEYGRVDATTVSQF